MKKIIKFISILLFVISAVALIYYIYWPYAINFINAKGITGDALMHLANIISFKRNHPFPLMAWKTEWGGYPVIEGYPWLHYYLIQPFLNLFQSTSLAIDYYSAAFLFLYYFISFVLFFYTSKNAFLAILFTLVVILGADSQMPFTVNAFMTFTSSQFFLPLILLITIVAREKNNFKLLVFSAILLSIAFFSHGAMTGMVIIPIIFPFLVIDLKGKITKETIKKTFWFFVTFAFLSTVQIYQFISYSSQGYLRGVKPFPIDIIPSRLVSLIMWMNPVLIILVPLFLILFIFSLKEKFISLKPYLLSLLAILFIFTLMLFNITSMNLVLLAERVLWAITLIFLLIFSKVVGKSIIAWLSALILTILYLYLILIVKPVYLIPDTLKALDPYGYRPKPEAVAVEIDPTEIKYLNKYDFLNYYKIPSWDKGFENYRTDGINWAVYSNWNIWSSNTRYKGRFPAAKDLPLEWSGLVNAAGYGMMGEAGKPDNSEWAINQSLFFFDWYAIRHLEVAEVDWPTYLLTKPIISDPTEESTKGIVYYTIDKQYISPMYAPTNAKTIAVVSPEIQYDNFIRTLSYSDIRSEKLIPIYLGKNLSSLNQKNLKDFDAVFIYGYKSSMFSSGTWVELAEYVKNGGNLIIETGQKVAQTEDINLPEVFPISETKLTVVTKPWNVSLEDNEITQNVVASDFNPLKTKYLPYAVSEASSNNIRNWAKPVLTKDGSIVLAYGRLGKGGVIWSGINLPFHAIDNRNTSETVIFANAINWFFPEFDTSITDFEVSHPKSEKIIVKSNEGSGFLIKENYNPGWAAKLNEKKIKIYKAGLMEMYVPRDKTSKNKDLLELTYYGSPIHWILFIISAVSFIAILVYLIFNKNIFSLKDKLPKLNLIKKDSENDY